MTSTKIYSKQTLSGGLHWFFDLDDKHITMRLAGKPAFILEKYQNKYGEVEGTLRFKELLEIINEIGGDKKSPFVFYINDIKK